MRGWNHHAAWSMRKNRFKPNDPYQILAGRTIYDVKKMIYNRIAHETLLSRFGKFFGIQSRFRENMS